MHPMRTLQRNLPFSGNRNTIKGRANAISQRKHLYDTVKQERLRHLALRWLFWAVPLTVLVPDYFAPALAFGCTVFLLLLLRLSSGFGKLMPIACPNGRADSLLYIPKIGFTALPLEFITALFFLWRLLGISYSHFKLNAISILFLWLTSFAAMLLIPRLLHSRALLHKFLFSITVTGGISGLIGTAQILFYKGGDCIFNPFWQWIQILLAKLIHMPFIPDFIQNEIPREIPVDINDRASSTFTNPVLFAIFMVMVFPFAYYCFLHMKGNVKKLLSLLSMAAILGGLTFSYSRGPYLALGVVVFILLFMGWKQIPVLAVCSPFALLAIWKTGILERLLSIFNSQDISINTRTDIWEVCLKLLRTKWLFGLGTSSENLREILIRDYGMQQPQVHNAHAHNLVLELLIENGILGLLLFAGMLLVFLWEMLRLCKLGREGRALGVTFIASVAGFCACGVTEYILYGPKLVQFFFLLLGIASAASRIYRKGYASGGICDPPKRKRTKLPK